MMHNKALEIMKPVSGEFALEHTSRNYERRLELQRKLARQQVELDARAIALRLVKQAMRDLT